MDNRRTKGIRGGLCYRCEHRAKYWETGHAPRMECGSDEMSVGGCYMYQPVRPVIVKQQNSEDPRPIFFLPMIAGRVRFSRVATDEETHLELSSPNENENEFLLLWARGKLSEED